MSTDGMKLVYRVALFAFALVVCYTLMMTGGLNDLVSTGVYREIRLEQMTDRLTPSSKHEKSVVLTVVVCGDRVQETLVMLKSAIIFSQDSLKKIIVITETGLFSRFHEKLSEWKEIANASFTFETRVISFPKNESEKWRTLFKPCAAQRLFLPNLLTDTDSILYVDTDVLFLSPLENVWAHFQSMNSTQFSALAPEHEDPHTGWYNRFAKHPFYGKLGVNSGVMLMNLTRMRAFNWNQYLLPILKQYKYMITWGDQDIINIIFHFHPERLYIYDCTYNYRSDHCMYMSVCKSAEREGVRVLHGSRGTFHSSKQPAFQAVFRAFQEFQLGSDPYQHLLLPMEAYLKQSTKSNCDKT
ncbi:glucoside xylosyltransferase 1 isoform X2 [Cimex lectularius]|uniref:UDP-D-xylose:beta-D-glucoside alpha-1,3-D-xylosyltransferase n=1 Tax=Cimex lectularius TaxID=79782 RepID=A0A8I6TLD7_CIMLE|nr:glucoside xylosyltransferase 1 isoform X2 [Cimex lectularius]